MSTTPTMTLPYPLFDADNHLYETQQLCGSDVPHPERLAQPTHFADALGHVPVGDRAEIMGGNLARLVTA
jgi:hypothetical protein